MDYIDFYIIAPNRLVRCGKMPREQIGALRMRPDEQIHLGVARPETHYVSGMELREYTPEQAARKALRRLPGHVWSDVHMNWVDARPTEQIMSAQKEEIRRNARTTEFDAFIFNGKRVRCGVEERARIDMVNGYVALSNVLPPEWPGFWEAEDGTQLPIKTRADWVAFYTALVTHTMGTAARERTLRARVVSQPREQVKEIKW